jgi:hypothetical protein
MPESRIAGQ